MNNMINVFLDNARQAIERGRVIVSQPVYRDYYDDLAFNTYYGGDEDISSSQDSPLGFTTGEELPPSWE